VYLAYVFLGSASGILVFPSTTLHDPAGPSASSFGAAVGAIGDLSADGFADVLVGVESSSAGGAWRNGAWVYYGGDSGIPTTPDLSLDDPSGGDARDFASNPRGVGDTNGDGYQDAVVGALRQNTVYVYQGAPGGMESVPAEVLRGSGSFGKSTAGAGDVNADGYADVVIGAPTDGTTVFEGGSAQVFCGSAAGVGTTPCAVLGPGQPGARFGMSVI